MRLRAADGCLVVRAMRHTLDKLAIAGEMLTIAAFLFDTAITFTSTVLRYSVHRDLTWAPDCSSVLIPVIAFIGGPCFFRRGGGMAYRALVDGSSTFVGNTLELLGDWVVVAVCGLTLLSFPAFFAAQARQSLPVLGIPASSTAISLGIGLLLLTLFTLERIATKRNGRTVLALLLTLVLVALSLWVRGGYASGALAFDPFWLIAPVVVGAFVVAVPIPLILLLGGGVYFVVTGDAPLIAIPTALQYGVTSFILLAIPFFIAAGALMEMTGMARSLVETVQRWCGHWSGGLLIATVVATYIFSGVSGSKAADMATIGAVMKQPVRERDYPAAEFSAVLCASAAMSETVPPSLAMLILGSVTNLSIGALFVAGIIPALVLAVSLVAGVILRARRERWGEPTPFSLRLALGELPRAIPALGVPVIVIGGIVGGFASPTEAGSLAVVYGLVAAAVLGRRIGIRRFYGGIRDAALTAGMVLLMVAAANVLAQAIVVDGLGTAIGSALASLHDRLAFLALSALALIVIGFLLEGFPAILIAAPIFLPAATKLGVDPLQFGILLIMATGIGVMMPPIGIGFYIACTVGEAPMTRAMRASAFYNVFLLVGLAIILLVPQLTLWLPHVFGLS